MLTKFPESFCTDLFKSLNSKNWRYAVLRNYDGLPKNNSSKDIDIIIDKEKKKILNRFITKIAKKHKMKIIWKSNISYMGSFVLATYKNSSATVIKLDFFYDAFWRGINFLNFNNLFKNTIIVNNIRCLNPQAEIAHGIIHYTLFGGKIKEKYLEKFLFQIQNNRNNIKDILSANFKIKFIEKFLDAFQKNPTESVKNYRKKIILNFLINNPSNFIRILFSLFKKNKFKGYTISVNGPDGVGKSSILKTFNDITYEIGISKQKVPIHLFSNKIRPPHALIKSKKSYTDYSKPYNKKPSGLFLSILRLIYYYIAFIFDSFIINSEKNKNHVVIYDRSLYDLIADPERFMISSRLNSLAELIIRKLDYFDSVIVFSADELTIRNRKKELSINKIKSLNNSYGSIAFNNNNVYVFNNDKSFEESNEMFINLLFDLMEKKFNN